MRESLMDALEEKLDTKLRTWKPEIAGSRAGCRSDRACRRQCPRYSALPRASRKSWAWWMIPQRGEVWLADLGLAAKTCRPGPSSCIGSPYSTHDTESRKR